VLCCAVLCLGVYPKLIQVPTHFFKLVVVITGRSDEKARENCSVQVSAGAFLLPNSGDLPQRAHAEAKAGRFDAFAVPIGELETLLGLQFFAFASGGSGGSDGACADVGADSIRQAIYKLDALVHPIELPVLPLEAPLGSALPALLPVGSGTGFKSAHKPTKPITLLGRRGGGGEGRQYSTVAVRHLCQVEPMIGKRPGKTGRMLS
jgi:hypothetical protein